MGAAREFRGSVGTGPHGSSAGTERGTTPRQSNVRLPRRQPGTSLLQRPRTVDQKRRVQRAPCPQGRKSRPRVGTGPVKTARDRARSRRQFRDAHDPHSRTRRRAPRRPRRHARSPVQRKAAPPRSWSQGARSRGRRDTDDRNRRALRTSDRHLLPGARVARTVDRPRTPRPAPVRGRHGLREAGTARRGVPGDRPCGRHWQTHLASRSSESSLTTGTESTSAATISSSTRWTDLSPSESRP